jgi:hypothetical protein
VTQQISNPHDKLFKQLLGEPENAADFVANNLPAEIVSHLDLSTLQVLQVSFMDAPSFARLLEIIFRYVLQVFEIPEEKLGHLVTVTLKPEVKELVRTTYEQLVPKGASRVLIRLLSKRLPSDAADLMPLLGQLSPERQDELGERILDARSPEEIREWLKTVCHN